MSNNKKRNKKQATKKKTVNKQNVSKESIQKKDNELKKSNNVVSKKENNKPDVNAYVNVLFEQKEEKKKSFILKLFVFMIIICIIGIGVYLFIDNKDRIINKILNNEHVKNIMNKSDESKNENKEDKTETKKTETQYTDKIAILTFHRITTEETKTKYFKDNEWVESVDMFEQQMKYLHDNNYKTLNLDEFNCWYDSECNYSKKTVVLTFDDGDLSFYYLVAPVLKKYDLQGTIFIVGSRTEEKEKMEFSDTKRLFIAKETIENSKEKYPNVHYESHSYDFHDSDNKKKVYDMTRVELQEDFDKMKEYEFKYIAYPFGNYDEALLEKTEDNGYIMGFTFRNYDYATRNSKRYEIPRFKVNGESNVETIKKILNY